MPAFLDRWGWVHPFVDGNGRAMRLHTHTLLSALGHTGGLWSPLRGFARNTERHYALLADADSLCRGDLDGRGNLSEQALLAWIGYVLDTCLDQVGFMADMLDFATMKARIEACRVFEATVVNIGSRQRGYVTACWRPKSDGHEPTVATVRPLPPLAVLADTAAAWTTESAPKKRASRRVPRL